MKKNKKTWLAAALAVLAILCAGVGIRHYLEERNAGQEYEQLKMEVVQEPESVQEETAEPEEPEPIVEEEPEEPESVSLEIPIDFEALQEQNPDVYAWIRIPGTNVDYPILQRAEDNAFYLDHDIDGNPSKAGAIYTENYNSKDFNDPNTVIYGHNMKNGSMFRTLHNYEDRSFFDENRELTIYLPGVIRHYQIFAAYVSDNKHLLLSYNFKDEVVFNQYLGDIRNKRGMNAFIDTSMEITAEDKILTLSTCNKGIDTQRYLVQAVLVSIENETF